MQSADSLALLRFVGFNLFDAKGLIGLKFGLSYSLAPPIITAGFHGDIDAV